MAALPGSMKYSTNEDQYRANCSYKADYPKDSSSSLQETRRLMLLVTLNVVQRVMKDCTQFIVRQRATTIP